MQYLTPQEQERMAFCAGLPDYEAIAENCDYAEQIEALQQEVNELQETLDNVTETASVQMLQRVFAQLTDPACNKAAGRRDLAKQIQRFLRGAL